MTNETSPALALTYTLFLVSANASTLILTLLQLRSVSAACYFAHSESLSFPSSAAAELKQQEGGGGATAGNAERKTRRSIEELM